MELRRVSANTLLQDGFCPTEAKEPSSSIGGVVRGVQTLMARRIETWHNGLYNFLRSAMRCPLIAFQALSSLHLSHTVSCRVSLAHYSGAAEGSVAALAFRCRFGESGKLRLFVEGARWNFQKRFERRVIGAFHCGAQGFLYSMIARNERGIDPPHGLCLFRGRNRPSPVRLFGLPANNKGSY